MSDTYGTLEEAVETLASETMHLMALISICEKLPFSNTVYHPSVRINTSDDEEILRKARTYQCMVDKAYINKL